MKRNSIIHRLVDYPLTPHNRKYTENCSTDYSPTDLWKLAMRTPQLVRNSVYVLAVALDDMYKSKCSATSGLCANMTQVVRTELVDYIRNVSFYGKIHYYYILLLSCIEYFKDFIAILKRTLHSKGLHFIFHGLT